MNLILNMTFMAIAASVIAIRGESADGIEGKKSRAAATYTAEEYANYDAKAFARDLPQLKKCSYTMKNRKPCCLHCLPCDYCESWIKCQVGQMGPYNLFRYCAICSNLLTCPERSGDCLASNKCSPLPELPEPKEWRIRREIRGKHAWIPKAKPRGTVSGVGDENTSFVNT